MPYYVKRDTLTIVVTAPGRPEPPGCQVIDGDTLAACVGYLHHDLPLSARQADALLEGNVALFMAELPGAVQRELAIAAEANAAATSPPLPAIGRWEYKVVPVAEMGGLATAKGTAGRMEALLNQLAGDGWELVTTSERDARWMAGETVLLTVRRFVVTEHMFAARVRAEERIRRAVAADLDSAPDAMQASGG